MAELPPPEPDPPQVSLTSTWFIRPGCEETVLPALQALARAVESDEPGTLTYLVHVPAGDPSLQSLPPTALGSVVFFEVYRDADAFRDHVNGPLFTGFVDEYGPMFVTTSTGQPFTNVDFLTARAGFVRPQAPNRALAGGRLAGGTTGENQHPSVMFEVMALDQSAAMSFYEKVFSWSFEAGSQGFQYVRFPSTSPPLMGGIGQADPNVPGLQPGCAFYVTVDALQPVIDAALSAGGAPLMPPTEVDGYQFAMFRDPEQNPIGLVEPFTGAATSTHPSD